MRLKHGKAQEKTRTMHRLIFNKGASMSQFENEFSYLFGKATFKGFVVLVVLAFAYIMLALVFSFWPFSVAKGVVGKVVNAESIVNNYQWFYDQYNTIQSQKINYESVAPDAYERNGMRMVLNNSIAEYNSRSKQITRNLWKPNDLPYQLELVR